MSYFKEVKENDEVFGVIFGKGTVTSVWTNSFYTFEVQFENGHSVPYTIDGIPGWNSKLDTQTVFYKKDIDMMSMDITPSDNKLSFKKIIKLRTKNKLEVKCPSGIWQVITHCPSYIIEEYIVNNRLHLFRKKKNN